MRILFSLLLGIFFYFSSNSQNTLSTGGGSIKLENSAFVQGIGNTVTIGNFNSEKFEKSTTQSLDKLTTIAKQSVLLLKKSITENKKNNVEAKKAVAESKKKLNAIDSIVVAIIKQITTSNPNKEAIIASFNSFLSLTKKELQLTGSINYSELVEKKLDTLGNFIYPLATLKAQSTIVKTTEGIFITINNIGNLQQIVFPPSEHILRFKLNNKFGFMNEKGSIIISPKYDYALDFHNERAAVTNNNAVFYIDKQGNELFKDSFIVEGIGKINSFSDGYAIIEKGSYKYFIRTDGTKLFPYRLFFASDFKDGIAIVSFINKHPSCGLLKATYIDTFGNNIYGKCFDYADQFNSYNIAVVRENIKDFESGLTLIRRRDGKKIEGCAYFNSIGLFSEGLAPFSPKYKSDPLGTSDSYFDSSDKFKLPIPKHHGYIDTLGNIRISDNNSEIKFRKCENFYGGLAIVLYDNNKYGLINKDGLEILKPEFDKIEFFYDSLHFKAVKDGKVKYLSLSKNGIVSNIDF